MKLKLPHYVVIALAVLGAALPALVKSLPAKYALLGEVLLVAFAALKVQAAKSDDDGPKPPPLPVLMLAGVLAFVPGVTACNASSDQLSATFADGADLGVCVLAKVLGGLTDPASLLSCAGATEKLVVQVIDDFEAKHAPSQVASDAGPAIAADGISKPSLSVQDERLLDEAKAHMVARLAAKSGAR